MKALIRLSVTALAVILIAPALKVRFELSDLLVYYLPLALFMGSVFLANTLDVRALGSRLGHASIYCLLLLGPTLALLIGGGEESSLYGTIVMNTMLGVAVVMFPWSTMSFDHLLKAFAILGALLAVHTLLFFGSDEAIREVQIAAGADYQRAASYLAISFAMGIGTLCATYFVIKNFNPVSLLLFGLNWMGLAMGRGRGSFLFCVLVSLIYIVIVMRSDVAGFTARKKTISLVLLASFIPIVFIQLMKIERMRYGLYQILFNLDVEAERGGRGELMEIAMQKISYSPLIGNGLGEYMNNPFGHPHNMFLQYGVDSGIVGIVGLLLFFAVIFRRILRALKLSNPATVNIVYVSAALFVFMILNFLKSGDLYISRELMVMSGLPIAAYLAIMKSSGMDHRIRLSLLRRTANRELSPDIHL